MAMFIDPIAVQPRDGFRIWVRYEDGVEGEIDLSHLAGKGVFKAWEDREFFEGVHISNEGGCVCWGCPPGSDMELDIAPETGYAYLIGITREQINAMPDEDSFWAAIDEARANWRVPAHAPIYPLSNPRITASASALRTPTATSTLPPLS